MDTVGGALLSGWLRHIRPWGNVAAVGNAGGPSLDTTVFPFILRGVSLAGASSSNCPMLTRRELWQRIAREIPAGVVAQLVDRVVPLAGVREAAALVLDRQVRGRILNSESRILAPNRTRPAILVGQPAVSVFVESSAAGPTGRPQA